MQQHEMSDRNKTAWSHRTVEAWNRLYGSPSEVCKVIKKNPRKQLWRTINSLGDVAGKRIINLLGSNGRKAVPLALLGADVTVLDISEGNMEYALALAKSVGVKINYILSDVLSLDLTSLRGAFDIVLMELGIMHYFLDLNPLATLIFDLLKTGGRFVLNESHPIKKCIKMDEVDEPFLKGNYFDDSIVENPIAYYAAFEEGEREELPKCLLRRWTLGEIVTAIARANLIIKELTETPGQHANLPGHFTLVAKKPARR